MPDIDSNKCNGCGNCVDVCPEQAIVIHNGLAVINQRLCIQCGTCSKTCPTSAIQEILISNTYSLKGGDNMLYGYGRGFGRGTGCRGGAGYGFRGSSPPWPYSGRGRGGIPRCWYPEVAMALPYASTTSFNYPRMTQECELSWLKDQSEAIKTQLSQIESRIQDLETANK